MIIYNELNYHIVQQHINIIQMNKKSHTQNQQFTTCKCEHIFKKKVVDLEIQIRSITTEIGKIWKYFQKNNNKQSKWEDDDNLLLFEIPTQTTIQSKPSYSSFNHKTHSYDITSNNLITNKMVVQQFDILHDQIFQLKDKLMAISGIQCNLQIQASISKSLIQRQCEDLKQIQQLYCKIQQLTLSSRRLQQESRVSGFKITWIVDYLQKCGYKYISKAKSLG